ncbi:hypothetical protein IMG5_112540 [Ichthyophthirius multifiliis]|uniref:Ion transport domain-containing protein n=1 Tax=Ichthyophthirius multifiliis TaxID=5932 RepID=G0QTW8_ICHMU|nr:hypothetical protein IMG5_112540 [Ichthyophthirius multifiliis]EGR31327.1 hypothetical protein IMG5_112540 [Ichthyophthirius multifiliis]|eukprot:XP_004034813.1 hypothetical protein IMG5_112540 [Ichthyophthirius multifiliis]
MAIAYEGSPKSYDQTIEQINLFFTAVFIVELIFKLISYGIKGYWISSWNKFDMFIVLSSIVDLILNFVMGNQSLSFLRVGPQLARIMRVMRVTRLLKLVKSMQGLQKLIETLVFSLPSLINVGALLLLVFFIYSVLGVFIFKEVTEGDVVDKYNNFSNFGFAMITLFRCATGEDWFKFMFDLGKISGCITGQTCGTNYNMKPDNPLQAFNENLEKFRSVWSEFTAFSNGEKINTHAIVNFLCKLPSPLGFYEGNDTEKLDKHYVAKAVMSMKLADDGEGNVFFNEMLFACMKKAYGEELVQESGVEIQRLINKKEFETKQKLEEKKRQTLLKKKQLLFTKQNNHVNPILLMLFCGMAFKSWKNYIDRPLNQDGSLESVTIFSDDESDYMDDLQNDIHQKNIQNRMENNVQTVRNQILKNQLINKDIQNIILEKNDDDEDENDDEEENSLKNENNNQYDQKNEISMNNFQSFQKQTSEIQQPKIEKQNNIENRISQRNVFNINE